MPMISATPKPRTIGIGERSRMRKPVAVARPAVAMIGAPADAAITARSIGSAPEEASSKRAWNWMA